VVAPPGAFGNICSLECAKRTWWSKQAPSFSIFPKRTLIDKPMVLECAKRIWWSKQALPRLIDKTPFLKECESCKLPEKGVAKKLENRTGKPKILHSIPVQPKTK
jgi:hypothetical protein